MITLDSPVAAVLGDHKKQARAASSERLGLRTVGDLLRHFPRRYVEDRRADHGRRAPRGRDAHRGRRDRPQRAEDLPGPAHRPARRTGWTRRSSTDGPSLRMTFFAKNKHIAEWQARPAAGRPPRHLPRQGRAASGTSGSSRNPQMVLFGSDDGRGRRRSCRWTRSASSTRSTRSPRASSSWDLQRAVAFALTVVDDVPDADPGRRARTSTTLLDVRTALELDPRARRLRPGHAAPSAGSGSRRRWSPSWCWPGAAGRCAASAPRRGPAARAGCSRRSTSGCRSSSPPASARSAPRSSTTWPSRTR